MRRPTRSAPPKPAQRVPLLATAALAWLVLADIPTAVGLGPISLSGAMTVLAGITSVMCAPMLLAHGRVRHERRPWPYLIAQGRRRGVVPISLIAFAVVVLIGLLRNPSADAMQNAFTLTTFVAMIAYTALRTTADTAAVFTHRMAVWMGAAGVGATVAFLANVQLWGARPFALAATLAVGVLVPVAREKGLARWTPLVLVIAIGASLSRTALIIAVLLVAFIFLRSRYGARGFRIALGMGVLAVTAVIAFLTIPELRDRFTDGDNAVTIGGVSLNTSGRAVIWALVIAHAMLKPFLGWGAGSASEVVAARYPNIGHPHNDYLRLWNDYGLVGVGLFVIGLLVIVTTALFRALTSEREVSAVHWSAVLGTVAVASAAATDNVLIYPFVMLPLGAVIGMSIAHRDVGRRPIRRRRARPAAGAAGGGPVQRMPVTAGSGAG